jgi:hypothetical protein
MFKRVLKERRYSDPYALKGQRHLRTCTHREERNLLEEGETCFRRSFYMTLALKGSDCLHLRPLSSRYVLEERRKEWGFECLDVTVQLRAAGRSLFAVFFKCMIWLLKEGGREAGREGGREAAREKEREKERVSDWKREKYIERKRPFTRIIVLSIMFHIPQNVLQRRHVIRVELPIFMHNVICIFIL